MIFSIVIPDLGATGGDVTLEEWFVEPGQEVTAGQPLFIVATDKASVEVEAFRGGFIRVLQADVGQSLPIGSVVALLADSLEEPIVVPGPETEPERTALHLQERYSPQIPQTPAGQRILASPLARRIAKEEAVDLGSLRGSGTQGQILKRDVIAAITERELNTTTGAKAGSKREILSPMQLAIAERTKRSKDQAPHFYATITVEMLEALTMRQKMVGWAERKNWPDPSITDICIKAAALSLREFPLLNANFDGEAITTYSEINIGLVIGLPRGMLVPVIHGADRLDLYKIATTSKRLRQMAEAGRLGASDLSGGTFTLSNLGMFGLDSFTAVINPPQTGILALGAVLEKPVVSRGTISAQPQMIVTLSVDHRVIDGITAARFITTFKEMLENPNSIAPDFSQDT
jgi:pyruvate dehydrogenase E2 component (dihydrolipoamide acetyltransferase)